MTCPKCGYSPDVAVRGRWTFTVPLEVKSGNERLTNVRGKSKRARWAKSGGYRKRRDAWQMAINCGATLEQSGRPKKWYADVGTKRRVTVTRVMGPRQREFDRDNLFAGCKVVFDALVRTGLLWDDGKASCEQHVLQERGERAHTRIEIEELT